MSIEQQLRPAREGFTGWEEIGTAMCGKTVMCGSNEWWKARHEDLSVTARRPDCHWCVIAMK